MTGEIQPVQGELGGLPPKRPGIWPDVEVLGHPQRVYLVNLGFGGGIELQVGDIEAEWIAEQLSLGGGLDLEIRVSVDRTGHKLEKGTAVGIARVAVWDVAPAGEEGTLIVAAENRRMREEMAAVRSALVAARQAAIAVNGELGAHFGDEGIPELVDAHLRELLDRLDAGLER